MNIENVKIVTLKSAQAEEDTIKVSKRKQLKKILPSWLTGEDKDHTDDKLNANNETHVQVKLVDLGGHTAMMLVIIVVMYPEL